MANQKIATKTGSPTESPSRKRKIGITTTQKQALMDNLQLEVTERARKLRAQYNLQAQGLRTRIEIRVNRIPMALRKLKMGDLLLKHTAGPFKALPGRQTATSTATSSRTVTAVEKDYTARPATRGQSPTRTAHAATSRSHKRNSDDMAGGDKENLVAHDGTKKRPRLHHQPSGALPASSAVPSHAPLSPASSNSRLNPRDRPPTATSTTTTTATAMAPPMSPVKPFVARPPSPEKQAAATNLLSTMVEKARSTRAAGGRKPMGASTTSSTSTSTTRSKKGAAATATTAASRTAGRVSGNSESSEGSTSTVVRKTGRGRPAGATGATAAATAKKTASTTSTTGSTRKTVMSSIKKGVANAATKRGAAKAAAAAAGTTGTATSTRSGRILRKRE